MIRLAHLDVPYHQQDAHLEPSKYNMPNAAQQRDAYSTVG
jgi:hypothetical protein